MLLILLLLLLLLLSMLLFHMTHDYIVNLDAIVSQREYNDVTQGELHNNFA